MELSLKPAAADTMSRWHGMVAAGDLSALRPLLHDEAVFRSPAVFKPYEGGDMLAFILQNVWQVFANFEYHRQLASADGLNVVLEFIANVGEREVHGIDMIQFDEAGLITRFEVMVRPMSGLHALAEEMGKRFAMAGK